jgi:hypothetical protein
MDMISLLQTPSGWKTVLISYSAIIEVAVLLLLLELLVSRAYTRPVKNPALILILLFIFTIVTLPAWTITWIHYGAVIEIVVFTVLLDFYGGRAVTRLLKRLAIFLLYLLAFSIGTLPMWTATWYAQTGISNSLAIATITAGGLLSGLLYFWFFLACTRIAIAILEAGD